MLSCVAAVKAPRTHNRRRVTGSSGRRREGRESEPQRPNVSRHLFYSAVLLLIVVMMCCGSEGAAEAPEQSTVSKFEWKVITEGVTVESLGAPGLLKVGSDVFVVAEAQCNESQGTVFTGIASQLLTTQTADKPVDALKDPKDKTQVLQEVTSEGSKKKVDVSRPTTVMKGKDIYMLVGKYSPTDATGKEDGRANDGGLLLVKGKVSDESDGEKRIKWKDTTDVPQASVGEQLESWTGLIGSGGSGVHTDDGRLMFPVEGTKKENKEGEKTVSLIIYSSEDTTEIWKLSKEIPEGGCSDPSVVEWKDKLIMMTACDGGRRRVYESGDKGESWTEALGTLSRVWGNKQGKGAKTVRSGFITARIDGDEDKRNVMLVVLPVYSKKDSKKETDNGKGKLHLWLTDNTHIVDIGPVSDDDDAAASSLLYKSGKDGDNERKEELIALYEKKKGDDEKPSPGMVSVLLTAQLQRVKDVLATWKEVDERVSQLCTSSAVEDTSPDTACSPTVKVTDGLVGFLSGNFSENTWRDEYLGVNATVKKKKEDAKSTGATGYAVGVKFTGAWAEWPVGEQGENQLYHFANYNFTIVATVSIHGVPQEEGSPIPLMGVKVDDDGENVLLGLSYNKEKKWQVLCSGGQNKEHSSTWEKDTKHQVVLMLRNGTQGSAYVDGQPVGGDEACALENKDSKDKKFSHFYIGGDGNSAQSEEDVSVTVTNVLLYNRPLSTAEITALNPNKASSSPVVPDNGQGTLSQSSSAGPLLAEQESLNENEGAGGGRASPPEPSTVTTSLGKEQSVRQSALRASPGGSKHVDAASSSDGDPRVGSEAGGTEQGDTPPQTPVDTPDKADTNAPTATNVAQIDPADTTEVGASSGANGEPAEGANGQEELHAQHGEVKAAALSSSLGNVSQGNNSDAGTVRGSGLLPSLLLLLGLWVFAAL
ncbi:trans-sialidase [Trypanosoma cruzi Dm28c]|uniref:Trans-sialidase n=2 Tax=Trypanosoma cruzi TaxID=5693 RepID=V5BD42_TRYCR|nr:trans-sialidase [Trypanosoma cruzi Dm28c]PBJ78333.1 trans-sialidase [Trypanosoma cruzi cruzi]PWU97547.1 putative trans-sialidase, Group V [Trypanosoma cruzi]